MAKSHMTSLLKSKFTKQIKFIWGTHIVLGVDGGLEGNWEYKVTPLAKIVYVISTESVHKIVYQPFGGKKG